MGSLEYRSGARFEQPEGRSHAGASAAPVRQPPVTLSRSRRAARAALITTLAGKFFATSRSSTSVKALSERNMCTSLGLRAAEASRLRLADAVVAPFRKRILLAAEGGGADIRRRLGEQLRPGAAAPAPQGPGGRRRSRRVGVLLPAEAERQACDARAGHAAAEAQAGTLRQAEEEGGR